MITRLLPLLLILSFTACTNNKQTTSCQSNQSITMDTFLYEAILEGLKQDKITTDLAQDVAKSDRFFIGKCNICKAVNRAFTNYQGFSNESQMKGQVVLLKAVIKQNEEGKHAMKTAVKSYLDQHFEKSNLTEKQKELIQKELINESDKGLLLAGYSFCASCNGVQGACKIELLNE